jgi:hypothetical protein
VLILGSRKQDISQKQEHRFVLTRKLSCVGPLSQQVNYYVLILGSRKQDISQKQERRFVLTSRLSFVDIGQQEAGHLTETGTQVCPNKEVIMC